ncbi:D-aminoacyl-tRNA deacylase [Candidatus Magnetaquicoccaceae bacterium FCR-1]|uniref:D-aminoacyl-tRNA deacylase n=1 Tax=Candidatus Magnetaquiglobus chichijimensis TaxID=3141448 RepID=A0ABQ0C612_9PROT
MKAVVQRVSEAGVTVAGEEIGAIGAGLVVLLAVEHGDGEREVTLMARKIAGLRIFPDERGRMHHAVRDIHGGVLAISQFTLAANLDKGFRPSFDRAEEPNRARMLFDSFCQRLHAEGVEVATGRFGADMRVRLINDGPVTFTLSFTPGGADRHS